MAVFTTNKKAQKIIWRRKYFSPITGIIYFILMFYQFFWLRSWQITDRPLHLVTFICLLLGSVIFVYYTWSNTPAKYNHLVQSIETTDGTIKLTTFPFKTIIIPFNLKPIEFTVAGNKLEVRKANWWNHFFTDRELFIVMHEEKKYYLIPEYFDDFESMLETLPFVKVAAS